MGSPFDFSSLSSTVNDLSETNIVEVARYGWGRQGLIPLWFGEGDVPRHHTVVAGLFLRNTFAK